MIVSAFTSTIELPIPMTASAATATAATGSPPISASGSPNRASPIAKSRASRPPRREEQGDEPADEPTDAHRGVEQPDAGLVELEQLERGDDDEHVERAGDERLRRVEANERSEGRLARDRRDPGAGARARPRAAIASTARAAARSARSPMTRNADQRKLAPFAAKTTSGLETARSRPPSAGPRNVPTLSSVLDATFAAVSSDGERTSAGRSAACAGRKTVPEIVESATRP